MFYLTYLTLSPCAQRGEHGKARPLCVAEHYRVQQPNHPAERGRLRAGAAGRAAVQPRPPGPEEGSECHGQPAAAAGPPLLL